MTKKKLNPQRDFDLNAIEIGDGLNINENDLAESSIYNKEEIPIIYKTNTINIARRAKSEDALFKVLNYEGELKKGYSYHFLSAGDIDILSYLKYFIRFKKYENVLISTWCMARHDITEIKEWLDNKQIKTFHLCLGEIFKGSYGFEYGMLRKLQTDGYNIKITIFRNHSKIILGHAKPNYYFVIESSANVNTNPRTENTTVFIDKELYWFYYKYFNSIKSYENET